MHKPGGTSTNLREQGFGETLAREFPALRLAARQYGMSDAARARAAAENILTAHPDLAGLFASSEASSLGAIQAIKSRGLAGRVKLVTFDTSDAHVAALREGTIDAMLVQDAFRLGYEAVGSLARKLRGETPERSVAIAARVVRKADLDDAEVQRLVSATV
jgi:ribose transport system substrate-binding protein